MNGVVSDMFPKYCEFLEFDTDENNKVYKGFLTYTDSQGLINSGSFKVDITNLTISFTDNDEFIGHRFKLKLCTLVHFALASKNVSFDGCQSSERMDIALPD
jgi:hypothetical protein